MTEAGHTKVVSEFEIFEGDTASVDAHLAVLSHIRGNLETRANYIKRLPVDKLNDVLEIIMEKL